VLVEAIFTVGHSTRPVDVFIDLLPSHGIERLIDVRTIPRSRRHPPCVTYPAPPLHAAEPQ
jgi:uncharacterized protein (DUF488 family)